jgi:hypothetical protein
VFANLLEFGLGGLCRADRGPGDVLEVLGALFLIRNALLEFVDALVFLLERGRLLVHPLLESLDPSPYLLAIRGISLRGVTVLAVIGPLLPAVVGSSIV